MKILNHIVLWFSVLILSCEGPIFEIPKDPDSTPPVLTITFPPDQSILSDTVLVTAYAFDNDELKMVTVYLNDSIVIESKEEPFEFFWITKDYEEDKSFTIYAVAEDISGNRNQTHPIQVVVDNEDNINPTGVLIFPYTGQTLSGEITIIIEADDNESVEKVIIYIEGDSVISIMNEPYFYIWDTSLEIDDITYTIHAHVIDNAGNQITLGPISVLIDNLEAEDNIPPSGNITYPPASATVAGTIDIQVTAYDNYEVGFVDFIIDGSAVSTDSIYPYEYSWNTLEVSEDAEHVINVTITDWIGNTTALFPVSVFVNNVEEPDNTPPTIVLTEPAANQTVSGNVSIVVIPNDNVGINRVEFYHGNSLAGTAYTSPYEFVWNTTMEIDDTEHIWYVKAFDTSENEAQTQSIAVYVNNDDNTHPSGFILYPYAGQTLSGLVTIQVSASDDIGVGNVGFFIDGINVYTDSSDPYYYEWNTELVSEDEEHIIFITITDQSGNETDLSPIAVLVNNEPSTDDSTPPVVALLTPISGQTVSDSVLITGFASDNMGIDHVKFFINDDLVATVPDSPYTHLWNTFDLANGTEHIIRMVARDFAGNESTAQPVFVIIQNVYNQQIENLSISVGEESIFLSWDAPYDAQSYKIFRNSAFLAETTNQTYEDTPDAGLEYCYQVSAVNSLGIEGPHSEDVCDVALLPAPNTFEASVEGSDITLLWSSVENASEYSITRNGDGIWIGTETTITDAGLDENTTYLYAVNAFDFEGTAGTISEPLSVTTHIDLIAPELSINIGTGEIELNWSSVVSAETYRIYLDGELESETSNLSYLATIDGGMNHCFIITAINEFGTEGPASNEECGEALFPWPENFSGTVSQNNITLTWSPVTGASSYSLSRDGSEIYNGSDLSYDDNALAYGTTYNYIIATINTSGESGDATDPLELTTHDEVTAPELSLSVSESTATLNWTSISSADNYRIYQDSSFVQEVDGTTLEIDIGTGSETCFTVTAVDQYDTESDHSNEECGTGS